jgi:xylulokinase
MRGVLAGLSHDASRASLTQAVIEGVAFSMRDCVRALAESGTEITVAGVIGGGARSRTWIAILSSVLAIPLNRLAEAEHGAALGAARLARLAATGESPDAVCRAPPIIETVAPEPALTDAYQRRFTRYLELSSAARETSPRRTTARRLSREATLRPGLGASPWVRPGRLYAQNFVRFAA